MAAYRRDLRSPAGWLPVHRDQLRAQRSVSSMGSLYLLPFLSSRQSSWLRCCLLEERRWLQLSSANEFLWWLSDWQGWIVIVPHSLNVAFAWLICLICLLSVDLFLCLWLAAKTAISTAETETKQAQMRWVFVTRTATLTGSVIDVWCHDTIVSSLLSAVTGEPCNTVHSGCQTLLEIYWNYFFLLKIPEIYRLSWKFSGLVCEFAHLSLILVTVLVFQSVSVQNISR